MFGVFLDIETSGLDPFLHDPLEIAFIIVDLLRGEERATYESLIQISDEEWRRGDPSSYQINQLNRELVKNGKTKTQIAAEMEKLFLEYSIDNDHAFFVCQNPSFDRPFFSKIINQQRQQALGLPYHWLDLASMYFVKKLVQEQARQEFSLKISKDAIAQALSLPKEERPHRAMNGVRHLFLCYKHLVGFV